MAKNIKKEKTMEVSSKKALAMIASGEAVVVDVRTDVEVFEFCRLDNAIHLPLARLQRLAGLQADAAYLDESHKPIAMHELRALFEKNEDRCFLLLCQRGNRSYVATEILRLFGFHNTYSIEGGITEWVQNDHPGLIMSDMDIGHH